MKPIWLDISGKIDPQTAAVYGAVGKAAQQLGMPYVVVGASARDLVMHYGYGAKPYCVAGGDFFMSTP